MKHVPKTVLLFGVVLLVVATAAIVIRRSIIREKDRFASVAAEAHLEEAKRLRDSGDPYNQMLADQHEMLASIGDPAESKPGKE